MLGSAPIPFTIAVLYSRLQDICPLCCNLLQSAGRPPTPGGSDVEGDKTGWTYWVVLRRTTKRRGE